ncbi:M14 family zinc carboxypeptidase [Streptomyces tropicalis]|uniref:M14 family zinc carboxypeptidase n=1 Tax=Streptomyces tropicalis TaxID=3034234 RepID=A0ABT6A0D0_9ACTN|nr:M14 family zinc carboxypeptidase [Streptomyces tropicalis]MDF3298096.1 M14 family zinc carboxypeptidase [Streptomyces tropicalis]
MDRYPTVADVTDGARRLVDRFPGAGRLRRIGTSRGGRPILMLSVGHGPRHVLVVAGPHPDEPVGGATALALAEHVARGAGPSAATGPALVTWDIVLCLDPDGAAVSEAGHDGAATTPGHTLQGYYRSAYRPVAAEQPEWAPIEGQALPESRMLFRVIDELRPVLQCSLHSTDVGGSWIQLTSDLPGLAEPFRASADALGIPLQRGTYDALYWENPSPAVHVLPPPDSTARLAAGSENIGRSTWCAPQRYGGVTAIVEVPMWATDLADDLSPHPDAHRTLRDLAGLVRDGGRQVTAVLDRARGFLPPPQEDPLRRVVEWMADGLYDLVADSWEPLARQAAAASGEDDPRRPTTAQVTALDIVARRQPLRAAGLLLRLLRASDDAAAPALHQELDALFTAWCTDFEKALRLRRVPVDHQVQLQTGIVTAAAESALGAVGENGRATTP